LHAGICGKFIGTILEHGIALAASIEVEQKCNHVIISKRADPSSGVGGGMKGLRNFTQANRREITSDRDQRNESIAAGSCQWIQLSETDSLNLAVSRKARAQIIRDRYFNPDYWKGNFECSSCPVVPDMLIHQRPIVVNAVDWKGKQSHVEVELVEPWLGSGEGK
jgi:hypothetical protein